MLRSRAITLLIAIVAGAAFLAGLLLDGAAGALLLILVAVALGGLTAAAWEHIPARGRPLRLVVLALVVAVAVIKLVR